MGGGRCHVFSVHMALNYGASFVQVAQILNNFKTTYSALILNITLPYKIHHMPVLSHRTSNVHFGHFITHIKATHNSASNVSHNNM